MENLIKKYNKKLTSILEENQVENLNDIQNDIDRIKARCYRDFLEDIQEEKKNQIKESTRGHWF